ncbi:uncharacterized protein EV422DRAFT_510461 [Fimicolochytrium jonesii]|uniref:uncharacterized protein n=1 Tax=Fimicolochytrium jonesii TaxID=1396493 RepID=UPI0022FE6CE9|nr:uncharacterized protein EV422DRAFT_510461 [Fimicolochytrium jonesii]KAI8815647.1 hypothetical protein EV422DRAFT_510461 [Fimicolochytrium jonesii]
MSNATPAVLTSALSADTIRSTRVLRRRSKMESKSKARRGGSIGVAWDLIQRLEPMTKREYADEARVDKLLKSPLLNAKERCSLEGYKKQRKKQNLFEVGYLYKQPSGYGRLYVDGIGLQTLSKSIRTYITNGYYTDIDVVNCQPTLIRFLFRLFGLACPADLERYVQNRQDVLTENGITDKKVVNRYLNKSKNDAPHAFLRNIHKELYDKLVPLLQESRQFKPLWQWIESSDKKYNRKGSFLSYVVATVENLVLAAMHSFFTGKGISPDSLIFDGMLVKADPRVDETLLKECERFIKERVGADLRLAIKQMICDVDYDKELTVDTSNVVIDSDRELSSLIDESRRGTSGRLALLAMYLMKDKYICIRRKKWYKFDKHRWIELLGCPSMDAMDILLCPIKRWYEALVAEIKGIFSGAEDETERRFFVTQIEKLEKEKRLRVEAIEDSIIRGKVMKDLEDLMDSYTKDVVFDTKPYLLCFENGVYDLSQDAIRPGLPEDYLTICVPYDLPDAVCPDIDAKLDALLERTGRNGKGILKDLTQHTLGENLCKFPKATILTTKRCGSSQANPEFVDLKGSRAVFLSEPCVGEKIKSATLRELTGNDKSRQRGLYGSQETVRPDFSLFLLCNGRPEMDAPDTDAIWDREKSIHFPPKFVEDPKLPHERAMDKGLKQKLPEYAPFFMLKLLRCYTLYRESGYKLDAPQGVLKVSQDYRLENNPVEKFYEEQVMLAVESNTLPEGTEERQLKDSLLPVSRLWSVFEKWRKDSVLATTISENGFYQKLAKLTKGDFESVKRKVDGTRVICYDKMCIRDYEWSRIEGCWIFKEDID